jgi:uncharacterized protein YigE (DUF2233 family)
VGSLPAHLEYQQSQPFSFQDSASPLFSKRFANKKVRHTKGIQNGGAYKKVFCSWDICDYKFLYFRRSQLKEEAEWLYGGQIYRYYRK